MLRARKIGDKMYLGEENPFDEESWEDYDDNKDVMAYQDWAIMRDHHEKSIQLYPIDFYMSEGELIDEDMVILVEYDVSDGYDFVTWHKYILNTAERDELDDDVHHNLSTNPIVDMFINQTDRYISGNDQELLEEFAEFLVSKNAYENKIKEVQFDLLVKFKSDLPNLFDEILRIHETKTYSPASGIIRYSSDVDYDDIIENYNPLL